jgi:hypothetical protein
LDKDKMPEEWEIIKRYCENFEKHCNEDYREF